LEKAGVRYVSGRSGKDKDDGWAEDPDDTVAVLDGDDDDDDTYTESPHLLSIFPQLGMVDERPDNLHHRQETITSSFFSAVDLERDRQIDIGWKREGPPQRRNASSGLPLLGMGDFSGNEATSCNKSYPGQDQVSLPPHRPLVGGGAAAAYEVARADHYMKLAAQKRASLDLISGSRNPFEPYVNTDASPKGAAYLEQSLPPSSLTIKRSQPANDVQQHYEMLKSHHMNLLKEIQETTIMMNIFQQQILVQQQEKMHEDLLKQHLLQQQLNHKQQMNLSTQQLGLLDHSMLVGKQTPKKVESSKQKRGYDIHSSSRSVNSARLMKAPSINHGFKASPLTGSNAGVAVNPNASGHQVHPSKKSRKSAVPDNNSQIEDDTHRVKRMQLEHLKAEILQKQALLDAMSIDIGQNKDNDATLSEGPTDLKEGYAQPPYQG